MGLDKDTQLLIGVVFLIVLIISVLFAGWEISENNSKSDSLYKICVKACNTMSVQDSLQGGYANCLADCNEHFGCCEVQTNGKS